MYAKDKACWRPNRVFTGRDRDDRYAQYIENVDEPHDTWRFIPLMTAVAAHMGATEKEARTLVRARPEVLEEFVLGNAKAVIRFAKPDYRGVGAEAKRMIDRSHAEPESVFRLRREAHPDMFLKAGQRILFYSDKIKQVDGKLVAGEPLTTLWDDVLSNNLHAEGGVEFPKGKKPEALIKRVLDLTTSPGDWVLDSFAGSGTTGAVAHKMGRRWIMVELGDHCHTHIIPRLRRVVDGEDKSGVTEATGWKVGGGFRYFRLAPSLLEKDRWGNWVVSKAYNSAMLAEALCKLEGFTYAPSETVYWQHGQSTERDFIYVTTQTLSRQRLAALSEEVGDDRSLLVYCMAFRGSATAFANLTVKKIPNAVLQRCEWGRDDYSLRVAALPLAPDTDGSPPLAATVERRRRSPAPALPLFERSE
jgi:adenine-specific DNA-methyltransferase